MQKPIKQSQTGLGQHWDDNTIELELLGVISVGLIWSASVLLYSMLCKRAGKLTGQNVGTQALKTGQNLKYGAKSLWVSHYGHIVLVRNTTFYSARIKRPFYVHQNGVSLKTQMRVIGKWRRWLWKKNILIAPWVLHSDSKSHIVLRLVRQTWSMTLSKPHVAPWTPKDDQPLSGIYRPWRGHYGLIGRSGEKEQLEDVAGSLSIAIQTTDLHFCKASCLCYCLSGTSVHRQMSIVHPDKEYLECQASCRDGAVIKALRSDSCACAIAWHTLQRDAALLFPPYFPARFRCSKGIVPVSWMKRMVLGISCGNKLL